LKDDHPKISMIDNSISELQTPLRLENFFVTTFAPYCAKEKVIGKIFE
jgi:hypothetical protein